MSKIGWFGLGVVTVLAMEAIAIGFVLSRADGFSAKDKPGTAEAWIAQKARRFAIPTAAAARVNPVAKTPEVLAAARAHWADHCATCHANDGSGENTMGVHMYPPAPDMRRRGTQDASDGELFYVIQNGIRHTGMPAWGETGHDEEDSWKLVHFIRHLPELTPEEKREMEKTNPKGPDELKEEAEEKKFLKGQSIDAPVQNHHH